MSETAPVHVAVYKLASSVVQVVGRAISNRTQSFGASSATIFHTDP